MEVYTLHIPVSTVDRYLTVEVYTLHILVSTVDRHLTVEVYTLHIPVFTVDGFCVYSITSYTHVHTYVCMYSCDMYIHTL